MKPKALCVQIRLCRKHVGLSQAKLAKELGITTTYLSKIENGWKLPSLPLLSLIARKTGRDILLRIQAEW